MRDLTFSHQFDGTEREVSDHAQVRGYFAARRNAGEIHERRIQEAVRLYADVIMGREHRMMISEAMNPTSEVIVQHLAQKYPGLYGNAFHEPGRIMPLRETMAVTDYQALTVDVLDRSYYSIFDGFPIANLALAKVVTLRDFRPRKIYLLDGGVTPLTYRDPSEPYGQRAMKGPVPQKNASLTTSPNDTSAIQYQPLLGQAGASINWSAMVNDDLGIFKDRANRLAIAANRGITKFITQQYVDASGPSATLFKTAYHNQIIKANGANRDNPPLDTDGLIDAINILMNQTDAGGDPIIVNGKLLLVYGPLLEGTVQNAMNGLNVWVQNRGGVPGTQADAGHAFPNQLLNTRPWMIERMIPVLDPYMKIVCTTSGVKDTMWGIFVEPESQPRPAIEIGFYNGFRVPQLYTRAPTMMRPGGGVDPTMGNFDTLDSDMKIISVMGGAQIEGRCAVFSTGQNS